MVFALLVYTAPMKSGWTLSPWNGTIEIIEATQLTLGLNNI